MRFEVVASAAQSNARQGRLHTSHGVVPTPMFMPVGTRASVRTQTAAQLHELAPPMILANTYHLLLRPGLEFFEKMGGLHRFMGWPRGILTDSGGYQVHSLAHVRAMQEEGAVFRSHPDRPPMLLTPELSIAMQRAIGADVMMVLDHCVASTASHAQAAAAMALTHRWAQRSLKAKQNSPQGLFAIVQGACYADLRRISAQTLADSAGFDGYAIGGLAVGEPKSMREDITELSAGLLPHDRPRYLMGVGMPIDLLEAVHRGVDLFDCILPTALAQQGVVFTSHGKLQLRRTVYRCDESPLDQMCACQTCRAYTRSYLHHLLKCQEPVVWQLLAHHNLAYYLGLMATIRHEIANGTFASAYPRLRAELVRTDEAHPPGPAPRSKQPPSRGHFILHQSPKGHWSVAHRPSGEIMHSVNPPDQEAHELYVEQSQRLAQALAGQLGRKVVVWDVGLGAGHNAMAVIRAWEGAALADALELVSFERDLDAFSLALANHGRFAHLHHRAPAQVHATSSYRSERLTWKLEHGDVRETIDRAPDPDIVLFDPFSSKVDSEVWQVPVLRRMYQRLRPGGELITYSHSTAVRVALFTSGFWVARGRPSGPKEATTIALKITKAEQAAGFCLLDQVWLEKWKRSSVGGNLPNGSDDAAKLRDCMLTHPQWVDACASAAGDLGPVVPTSRLGDKKGEP